MPRVETSQPVRTPTQATVDPAPVSKCSSKSCDTLAPAKSKEGCSQSSFSSTCFINKLKQFALLILWCITCGCLGSKKPKKTQESSDKPSPSASKKDPVKKAAADESSPTKKPVQDKPEKAAPSSAQPPAQSIKSSLKKQIALESSSHSARSVQIQEATRQKKDLVKQTPVSVTTHGERAPISPDELSSASKIQPAPTPSQQLKQDGSLKIENGHTQERQQFSLPPVAPPVATETPIDELTSLTVAEEPPAAPPMITPAQIAVQKDNPANSKPIPPAPVAPKHVRFFSDEFDSLTQEPSVPADEPKAAPAVKLKSVNKGNEPKDPQAPAKPTLMASLRPVSPDLTSRPAATSSAAEPKRAVDLKPTKEKEKPAPQATLAAPAPAVVLRPVSPDLRSRATSSAAEPKRAVDLKPTKEKEKPAAQATLAAPAVVLRPVSPDLRSRATSSAAEPKRAVDLKPVKDKEKPAPAPAADETLLKHFQTHKHFKKEAATADEA